MPTPDFFIFFPKREEEEMRSIIPAIEATGSTVVPKRFLLNEHVLLDRERHVVTKGIEGIRNHFNIALPGIK